MKENFHDLVVRSRSVRRFRESIVVPYYLLSDIIDAARLTPTAGNRQPTRFIVTNDPEINAKIFPNLRWLGYLLEDMGPVSGERPSAYIILLNDTSIKNASAAFDAGIVAQTIVLGANYYQLGCCIVGSVDSSKIRDIFNIDPRYSVGVVIALGYPLEEVVLEESKDITDVKYWRDENKIHHVPKLPLNKVIVGSYLVD